MLKDLDTRFFDTLSRVKLRFFETMTKKSAVSKSEKEVTLKADRDIVVTMAVVAQTRQLDMKNVQFHSLRPILWSMATSDGSLCKTNKATLSTFLEKLSPPVECLPGNITCIIDAMSIAQKRQCSQKAFSEVVKLLFSSFHMECQEIDMVFDVYRDKSIKNVERFDKRSAVSVTASIIGSHKIKQWQSFIKESANKMEFIRFMCKV